MRLCPASENSAIVGAKRVDRFDDDEADVQRDSDGESAAVMPPARGWVWG